MENLYFNGNASRKPLGMLSIATVQNNRKFSNEFEEVSNTQVVSQRRESQYLINNPNAACEISSMLFMDSAWARLISVIELNMVETILSGRPKNAGLCSKSAGVIKYKLRRKEAARRLDTVHQIWFESKIFIWNTEKRFITTATGTKKSTIQQAFDSGEGIRNQANSDDYFTAIKNLEDLCISTNIKKENSLTGAALEEISKF